MKRVFPGLVVLLTVLSWPGGGNAQLRSSIVSGVVRDAHGIPQMGALVELLTANATSVAAAFTDDRGRYLIPSVLPGSYRLRASAAFFLPTTRGELRLRPGVQAVINLTMSTLLDAADWLPTQPRHADEPTDDWKWTLRSTATRPLLKLIDPDSGMETSSSHADGPRKPTSEMHFAITNGDGAFGGGGVHQVLTLERSAEDADTAIFRIELGDPQTALPAKPSAEITAGYQARAGLGRTSRMLVSFQSHPELTTSQGGEVAVVRLASTQQISLGDAVQIDAGTLLRAERIVASRLTSEPYLRLNVRTGDQTVLSVRYASGRSLQGSADLDRLKPQLEIMADSAGRPISDAGHHTEIALNQKIGRRTLTTLIYADQLRHVGLAGSGHLTSPPVTPLALLTDASTGTFRAAVHGYTSQGLSIALSQSLSQALTARAEYNLGKALSSDGRLLTLESLGPELRAHAASAVSVSLRGKVLRTGTTLDAEYRWQPRKTLTQVNAFNASPEHAYLSFFVRQRLFCGRYLPEGLYAVIEATNLLEQGYQPVLGSDGSTLFLAQVPRAVQGGLAFNF